MDIRNAHVVVVGASKGTGAAISREMAAGGARLSLLARASSELEQIATETGGFAMPTDLTDLDSLDGVIARAEARNGPVDVLISNAALANAGPISELSAVDLRRGVHANMLAHMELNRQVLPGMLARRSGTLVICGSISTEVSQIHLWNYVAPKAGLTKFGIDLQGELRDSGLSVFVVVLGSIRGTQLSNSGRCDPVIDFADRRFGDFGVVTPEQIAQRITTYVRSDRRRAVITIPRMLGFITQLRLLPLRLMNPILLWPVLAEIRRRTGER